MIVKDKEVIVFQGHKTYQDVKNHFYSIDKRSIHTLNATFACDITIQDKLMSILEDSFKSSQQTLKRLKVRFDATPISKDDIIALNKFMGRMKQLRHISLSFGFCNLNLSSIQSIVEGVVSLSELKGLKLDLSGNSILSNCHRLLGDLWRVPKKYFKLKLCQCNIRMLEFSFGDYFHKSSANILQSSSIKEEQQKQGNQEIVHSQFSGQIVTRNTRKSSQNSTHNDEITYDKKDKSNSHSLQSSTIVYHQEIQSHQKKSIINTSSQQNAVNKQQTMLKGKKNEIQNENNSKSKQQIKQQVTRSLRNNRFQNQDSENSTGINSHFQQNQNIQQSGIISPENKINMEIDEDRKSNSQQLNQYEIHSNQMKLSEIEINSFHFKSSGSNNISASAENNNPQIKDSEQIMSHNIVNEHNIHNNQVVQQININPFNYNCNEEEYIDQENEDEQQQSQYNIEEDEDEDYDDKPNKNQKKSKQNKKKNNNLKTRSTNNKNGNIQKKQISKSKVAEYKIPSVRKESLQIHPTTAGKGEAYFKRVQSNFIKTNSYASNFNSGLGGIGQNNLFEKQYLLYQNELYKEEIIGSLFGKNSIQQNINLSEIDQSNQQQHINESTDSQNIVYKINGKNFLFMKNGEKIQQKRDINSIIIDLRGNNDLEEDSLKSLASILFILYTQVNKFHLKAPTNNSWNSFNVLNFGVSLPSVLDIIIDPFGFNKIAFSNIFKGISTAQRKLKFTKALQNETQNYQQLIQDLFCPEKDFIPKKNVSDYQEQMIHCNQSYHSKDKQNQLETYQSQDYNLYNILYMLEEEDFQYQKIFFRSQYHQICTICQNHANKQHFLQANTTGLHFQYIQEQHISIENFIEILDKVIINLHNQFTQIYNDGNIQESLYQQDPQALFIHYLQKPFFNSQVQNSNNDRIENIQSQNLQNQNCLVSESEKSQQTIIYQQQNQDSQSNNNINQINSDIFQKCHNTQIQQKQFSCIEQLQPQQQSSLSIPISKQVVENYVQNNSNNIINQDKLNSFRKRLERALKVQWIESVNMQFEFIEYYYEDQYDLVQKIYDIIRIISLHINIYKLYLSVYQGITPLILAQILFVEELLIDKIEAGPCLKDGDIFFINISKPKYIIRKEDLQIFAQMINSHASFKEIHINFDQDQSKFIQSLSHLLTRYRQSINFNDQTLTIYRENTPPQQIPSDSIDQYLEMMDESGNFQPCDENEQEISTQLWLDSLRESQKQAEYSPVSCDQTLQSNSMEREIEQEEHENIEKQQNYLLNIENKEDQLDQQDQQDQQDQLETKITTLLDQQNEIKNEEIPLENVKDKKKKKTKKEENKVIDSTKETKKISKKKQPVKINNNSPPSEKKKPNKKQKKQQNISEFNNTQEGIIIDENNQTQKSQVIITDQTSDEQAKENDTNNSSSKGEQFFVGRNKYNYIEKNNQNPEQLLY